MNAYYQRERGNKLKTRFCSKVSTKNCGSIRAVLDIHSRSEYKEKDFQLDPMVIAEHQLNSGNY